MSETQTNIELAQQMDDAAVNWLDDPTNLNLCKSMVENGQPNEIQRQVFRHIFKAGYVKGRGDCLNEQLSDIPPAE